MKKNEKNIFIIAGVVLVIVLVLLVWPRKSKEQKLAEQYGIDADANKLAAAQTEQTVKPGTNVFQTPSVFPLKNGSKGQEVKNVQIAINFNQRYYQSNQFIAEDGVFGPKTIAALAYDFNAPETVTAARYTWIMDRMKQGIPLGRVYVKDDKWPLIMKYYDDPTTSKMNRIKRLNVALGVYPSNTTDPLVHEFGRALANALVKKYKTSVVDFDLYYSITGDASTTNGFGLGTFDVGKI